MKSLHVSGTLDSLERISHYAMAVAQQANLSEYETYRLRLAVDEVATNIVLHGYRANQLQGDITVEASISPDKVTVCFTDTAVPYDPRLKPPPDDLYHPIEKRKIGGLGVYLTMETLDHFHYEYHKGCNQNYLTIYRNTAD